MATHSLLTDRTEIEMLSLERPVIAVSSVFINADMNFYCTKHPNGKDLFMFLSCL